MQTVLRTTTRVLSGGRVELIAPELPSYALVEVLILFPASDESLSTPVNTRSALDMLNELPGHRVFKTSTDVEAYHQEERSAWES